MLYIASIGVTLPMIHCGIFDILISSQKNMKDKIIGNVNVFLIVFHLVLTIIPMIFQMGTLIFGYIRHKKYQHIKP